MYSRDCWKPVVDYLDDQFLKVLSTLFNLHRIYFMISVKVLRIYSDA